MVVDLLSNVNPGEEFQLSNGKVLKNLSELADALNSMGADIFAHHVTPERNDFAIWVKGAVGDGVLSDRLGKANRSDRAYRQVVQRINELSVPKRASKKPVQVIGSIPSATEDLKGEFVDFLLGLVIGFIIGLIIKTLV